VATQAGPITGPSRAGSGARPLSAMTRRTISSCRIAARDDLLGTSRQQIKLAVPGLHLGSAELRGLGFPGVPSQALIERHVEVVAARLALVIIDEGHEHLRVVIGAGDASTMTLKP
jgi:hypothetical protein